MRGGLDAGAAIRSRSGEDEHLHATRCAVWRRQEVRIVRIRGILSLGKHAVITRTAAAEVVLLEVTCSFGETESIHDVVEAVGPKEHVGHFAVAEGGECWLVTWRWNAGGRIVEEVEDPKRRAHWPSGWFDPIGRDQIQAGVYVVSDCRIVTIVEPWVIKQRVLRD